MKEKLFTREEPGRKQMSSEAYKTEKNVSDFAYGSEKQFISNTEEQENTLYRAEGAVVPSFERAYCPQLLSLSKEDRQKGVTLSDSEKQRGEGR